IPKNDVEKVNTTFSFERSSAYQLDKILGEEEVYFITTYFVDPNIICNGGRTKLQYEDQGVGTGLWIQNGTNPLRDSVQVPLYEKDMEGTNWYKGGCFRTMGIHYWYGAHENMTCSDFFPITAIYNRGKLTNFAFASFGNYEFSRRFEHPSSTSLTLAMQTKLQSRSSGQHTHQVWSLYTLPDRQSRHMEFSRTFERIFFPNGDIEKRSHFLESSICRQGQESRNGRFPSLHAYPGKTPSPAIRLARQESDIASL
ncbi:hypothetical protein AVEN_87233-1, partial [Araneus ventricosus]